jgi:ketosteroid isomerase-like protein
VSTSSGLRLQLPLLSGCLLLCLGRPALSADPEPRADPGNEAGAAPKTNFFASMRQGVLEDFEHEVVRGHFDVGTSSNSHRYYCLVNIKTGKSESNAVVGKLVARPDGMTGIEQSAVSTYDCADAERMGILVTHGYVLASDAPRPAAPTAPAPPPPAGRAAAAEASGAIAVTAAPGESTEVAIMAAYTRFIVAQNSRDSTAVADLLVDSADLLWVRRDGTAVWGHHAVLEALQAAWQGSWKWSPTPQPPRIAGLAPDVAALVASISVTEGDRAANPAPVPTRWVGIFVKHGPVWRLASVIMTPLAGGPAPP